MGARVVGAVGVAVAIVVDAVARRLPGIDPETRGQVGMCYVDPRIDDCDGLELLEEIKEIRPDLPIIFYTAYDSYREDDKSVAADHYVVKSFNLSELKEKLAQVIRRVVEDDID